ESADGSSHRPDGHPRGAAWRARGHGGRRLSLRRARCVCRGRFSERRVAVGRAAADARRTFIVIPRRGFHRAVFTSAGLYNIGFGLFAALDPQWLFRFAGMPPLNHPAIFACLGMVVGLYGLLYLEVARVPERGWLLAAIGLLGKV